MLRAARFALLALALPAVAAAGPSITRWGAPGSGAGQLHSPFAVAPHRDLVYVSDFDNDRVQAFTREGSFRLAWGSSGADPGQLHGPAGLAADADGSILVADHYNRRIQRFTADGRFLESWPAGGAPVGIAVDAEGRVYATDLDAGRVRVWSARGESIAEWGGLDQPWGIAVDARGQVWVAEHGRERLARFGRTGEPLGTAASSGAAGLRGPMGLAVSADGSVLVTDLDGRIARFGAGGEAAGAVPSHGSDPVGLAIDESGLVWVADPARHQILGFAPDLSSAATGGTASPRLLLRLATPSRGSVPMRVELPSRGKLSVDVFSPSGRLVWSAPRADVTAGDHAVTWDGRTAAGRPASAGVYFVRVQLDGGAQRAVRRGRIVLLR